MGIACQVVRKKKGLLMKVKDISKVFWVIVDNIFIIPSFVT